MVRWKLERRLEAFVRICAEWKQEDRHCKERRYEGGRMVERERANERKRWRRCRMWRCNTDTFIRRRFYAETPLKQKRFWTQTHSHAEEFSHTLLHTYASTCRRLYALHARFLYPQTPLHTQTHGRIYTETLLHAGALTHRCIYTETLLHTNVLRHRRFHALMFFCAQTLLRTRTLLHTDAFTHTRTRTHARRRLTQTLSHTHTDAFAHTHTCTHRLLHTNAFTHRCLCTHTHTHARTHRRFDTQMPLQTHSHKHAHALWHSCSELSHRIVTVECIGSATNTKKTNEHYENKGKKGRKKEGTILNKN